MMFDVIQFSKQCGSGYINTVRCFPLVILCHVFDSLITMNKQVSKFYVSEVGRCQIQIAEQHKCEKREAGCTSQIKVYITDKMYLHHK